MNPEILRNLDAHAIQQYQQNRYPLLFIDFVEEAVPGKSAKGYKCFTFNEWFFPAHFPDEPNVPGFIQVESLTQLFLMAFLTLPGNKGKKTGFIAIENARFRKKIIPGNRLDIHAEVQSYRRGLARGSSVGYVNGELACSADLVIGIPDILNEFKPRGEKAAPGAGNDLNL
jgi:3-hydroxyacyl-[acyl-carrier-protein] dehydratase